MCPEKENKEDEEGRRILISSPDGYEESNFSHFP